RFGELDDSRCGVLLDDPRRFDPQQIAQGAEGLPAVLYDLAFHVADPGYFDGDFRKPPRALRLIERPSDRRYGLVDARLPTGGDFATVGGHRGPGALEQGRKFRTRSGALRPGGCIGRWHRNHIGTSRSRQATKRSFIIRSTSDVSTFAWFSNRPPVS